jgi:hypothetical protein
MHHALGFFKPFFVTNVEGCEFAALFAQKIKNPGFCTLGFLFCLLQNLEAGWPCLLLKRSRKDRASSLEIFFNYSCLRG